MQPDTDLEGSHLKRPFAQQRGGAILKSRIREERNTHIIKPKDKQIPQSHLHVWPRSADKQAWPHANEPLLAFEGSLHSFDFCVCSDMAAFSTSGCGERGGQQSTSTHTHSHDIAVLHYPFPCGSRGVYLLLHVKMTTGRDIIVRQRQVVGVQTGRREEWMQIIRDQQTLLELW